MALQNLELNGGNVEYEWIKPLDKVSEYASRQAWLPLKDLFCNRELEFDLTLEDVKIFANSFQDTSFAST